MGPDNRTGNTVIIDLGHDRGEPDTYLRPTRSTVPDWFAPVLLAVLVLWSSAASAAPPPAPLSTLLRVHIAATDAYAISGGDLLLAQGVGSLSMYDLGTGALRWRADATPPRYRIRTGAGVALLRSWYPGLVGIGDPGTTAISLATGSTAGAGAGNVISLSQSSALLAVTGVRSYLGPGRRVEGVVDRIDPVTGQTRWRVSIPSTAVLLEVPGPAATAPRLLLVHDNRTAAVHDLATGALLGTGPLPPADYGPDNPTVSGGLVLLRHPGEHGTQLSAYDPGTLGLRWSRPAGDADQIVGCGAYACLTGADGVRALDPRTGRTVWARSGWRTVELHGGALLAYGSPGSSSELIGRIEPRTGTLLVDLRGWRPVEGSAGADTLLVTRVVDAGARTMVAVAGPGDRGPRPIADLPAGTVDCQATPGRLVCRSMAGELVVWAYRRKG